MADLRKYCADNNDAGCVSSTFDNDKKVEDAMIANLYSNILNREDAILNGVEIDLSGETDGMVCRDSIYTCEPSKNTLKIEGDDYGLFHLLCLRRKKANGDYFLSGGLNRQSSFVSPTRNIYSFKESTDSNESSLTDNPNGELLLIFKKKKDGDKKILLFLPCTYTETSVPPVDNKIDLTAIKKNLLKTNKSVLFDIRGDKTVDFNGWFFNGGVYNNIENSCEVWKIHTTNPSRLDYNYKIIIVSPKDLINIQARHVEWKDETGQEHPLTDSDSSIVPKRIKLISPGLEDTQKCKGEIVYKNSLGGKIEYKTGENLTWDTNEKKDALQAFGPVVGVLIGVIIIVFILLKLTQNNYPSLKSISKKVKGVSTNVSKAMTNY